MTTQNKLTTTMKAALLGLVMMLCMPALGQERTDSLIINVGKSRIIFLVKDKQDLETLKNYDLNAILKQLSMKLENDSTEQQLVKEENGEKTYLQDTTIIINEPVAVEEPEDLSNDEEVVVTHKKSKGTFHNFNLEVGTNNYLQDGKFPDASNELYAVRPWGSWYVALTSVNRTYIGGPLYLEWGPSVSWYNFKFQDDNMRIFDEDEQVVFTEDTEYPDANFKKSKLTVSYVNFTVVPTIALGSINRKYPWPMVYDKKDDNRGFRVGAGGYIGYRIDSYSKIVYETDDKEKKRNHEDYHLNNFRYGLRFQLGYRGTDVFFNYDLNELFTEGQGPKLNAFSFGLIF